MQEVPGHDRIGRVRLRIEHRTPRGHRISFVRPQPREPEVKLHDCDARVELRELLEPVERPVGPRGERGADLRLQGVVPREQTRRGSGVTARVERLGLRQIARLGIRTKSESERERRTALTGARASWSAPSQPSRRPRRATTPATTATAAAATAATNSTMRRRGDTAGR